MNGGAARGVVDTRLPLPTELAGGAAGRRRGGGLFIRMDGAAHGYIRKTCKAIGEAWVEVCASAGMVLEQCR